jgi:hypothetical protein
MESELESLHFKLIPSFISAQRALGLARSMVDYASTHRVLPDTKVAGAPAVYDFLPFVRLLVESVPRVETLCAERVLPTYAYGRVYRNGNTLPRHRDRDACEISMTVNLSSDRLWPIWFETPECEERGITLSPGDAVVYRGCDAWHWREPFEGEECCQVFLHYVLSYGSRSNFYFDRNRG